MENAGLLPQKISHRALCAPFFVNVNRDAKETIIDSDMTLHAHWIESPFMIGGGAEWTCRFFRLRAVEE